MSKRKSRKQKAPNLPEETLARARQQAELAAADGDNQSDEMDKGIEAAQPKATVPARKETKSAEAEVRASQRKRRRIERAEQGRRDREKPLTSAEIAELLEHPIKTVTEAELKAQYGYVLADLRSMALLAAGLIAMLVVLAQFL